MRTSCGTRPRASTCASCSALGVRVAVDGFGRGYLSMSRLDRLPIDIVKLEPELLGSDDAAGRALLRAMVDAAHAVGIEVFAECVDDAESLSALREQMFDAAQGFLVTRLVATGGGGGPVRGRELVRSPEPR